MTDRDETGCNPLVEEYPCSYWPSHTRVRLSHDFKIGRSDPIFSVLVCDPVRKSVPIFKKSQVNVFDLRSSYDHRTPFARTLQECLAIIPRPSQGRRVFLAIKSAPMNRNSVTANLSIFKIGTSSSDFKISKIGSDLKIVR